MRIAWASATVLLLVAGAACASYTVEVEGRDATAATTPAEAIRVDPSRPAAVRVVVAPPEGTTAEVRAVVVALVVAGHGSPPVLERRSPSALTVPGGTTQAFEEPVDLAALARAGTGVFLVRVDVRDGADATVHTQEFYVRVPGNPFLTALGLAAALLTVAVGYGLWQILQDLKELKDAWDRHHPDEEEDGPEPALAAARAAKAFMGEEARLERVAIVKWAMTGLGVGCVAMAWAQALGFLPFDLVDAALVAGVAAASLLFLGVLAAAALRRMRSAPTS